MSLPFVVVEGPAEVLADAHAELVSLGWEVTEDLTASARSGDRVWSLAVTDDATAALAVLAAVEGAGLLVDARAERATVDRLCDDLRRLGRLDHRIGDPGPLLSAVERRLLDLLSDGVGLGAAATRLHLARRTADRRLASARSTLGVETTTQAIAAHRRRLDRLPRPGGSAPG
ncbi:hypothetical protein [Nocardioides humi]|uniref:HTH luxR-type domain-containing protein n=1 Tax=Nocardioides humi TaxID=449461 RepID=A0ABN1ZUQ9_9ACTN|nr:hypothetical protein [Nocardioides humi]